MTRSSHNILYYIPILGTRLLLRRTRRIERMLEKEKDELKTDLQTAVSRVSHEFEMAINRIEKEFRTAVNEIKSDFQESRNRIKDENISNEAVIMYYEARIECFYDEICKKLELKSPVLRFKSAEDTQATDRQA
jgi:hypothetical protein